MDIASLFLAIATARSLPGTAAQRAEAAAARAEAAAETFSITAQLLGGEDYAMIIPELPEQPIQ